MDSDSAIFIDLTNVQIGHIEIHEGLETHLFLESLPIIARRTIFYKGKKLEEMDVQTIIHQHP